jgi:hypothetical protein
MPHRLAPVLSALDLPVAELRAAELDGELFAIDGCWSPIDEPDRTSQRALALAVQLPDRVILERRSAAWVWGQLDTPPRPHDLCTAIGARVRTGAGWPPAREVVIDDDETVLLSGIRVTTPLRTVVDLARFGPDFDEQLALRLLAFGRVTVADCIASMERRRNLPGKRLAVERLTALETGEPGTLRAWALAGVDAVDVVDGVDAPHGVEQPVEVGGVAHLEHEAAERETFARGRDGRRQDVHVVLAEHPGDVGEQAGPVESLDLDLHKEYALR